MKFKNDNIKIAKNILDKYKILSKSSQQKRGKYVGAMEMKIYSSQVMYLLDIDQPPKSSDLNPLDFFNKPELDVKCNC